MSQFSRSLKKKSFVLSDQHLVQRDAANAKSLSVDCLLTPRAKLVEGESMVMPSVEVANLGRLQVTTNPGHVPF